MTFTIADFHDLVVLLENNPEWRAEVRRLVLTEDILTLPQFVRQLAQTVTELSQSVAELSQSVAGLSQSVAELTESQKRTEARVEELAEAQKRTDAHLEELAVAQNRTDAHLEELAEAQKRTDSHIEELAEAQKRTEVHLSRLETRFGATVEEEAADVLRVVLEKKGFRAVDEAFNLRLNGEVDVILPVQDVSGRRYSAVLEAKVRLSWRAVEAWASRMRSPSFRAALQNAGVAGPYLVYTYSMRADQSARQAAETFGVGLVTSRGEEVAPQGEV